MHLATSSPPSASQELRFVGATSECKISVVLVGREESLG
jgi:hypothetical protein